MTRTFRVTVSVQFHRYIDIEVEEELSTQDLDQLVESRVGHDPDLRWYPSDLSSPDIVRVLEYKERHDED